MRKGQSRKPTKKSRDANKAERISVTLQWDEVKPPNQFEFTFSESDDPNVVGKNALKTATTRLTNAKIVIKTIGGTPGNDCLELCAPPPSSAQRGHRIATLACSEEGGAMQGKSKRRIGDNKDKVWKVRLKMAWKDNQGNSQENSQDCC